MELVGMLRVLWRHRLLVVVAALVAVLVGLGVAYRIGFPPKLESRQYTVGVASLTALVDTPRSQIVDLSGKAGADIGTLAARASLLASLMTSSPIKDEIASRAGVAPDRLIAQSPFGTPPGAPPSGGASVSISDPKANILTAKIPNLESGEIPIIAVSTQAPDSAVAARLANESIAVLKAHLQTVAGIDKVPDARRVVVRQLGRADAATVSRGPARTVAVAAAIFVFFLGCVAILGVFALVNGWRQATDLEPGADDEPYVYGEASDDDVWFGHRRGLPRPTRRAEDGDEGTAQGDVIGFRGARGS
jgi:capsular polysaccharide biosynthesis protein